MKIGIDARMFGTKQAGIGRYIEQLILGLEKIDQQNEYIIFLRLENFDEFQPQNYNFRKILADIPWYSVAEQLKLTSLIKKEKIDVMHFPHFNVPLNYQGKFIITIHDLIMYHFPRVEATTLGPIKFFIKNKLHRLVLKSAVKKSQKVIVPSEFTKNDLIKTLKIKPEKIEVIYLSPPDKITAVSSENSQEILQKYQIDKPYILYVGNAYPHKNLARLLLAWKIFNQKYSQTYQLVLVGRKNHFYNKIIQKNITNHSIVFTDFIQDKELPILYQNSSAYIFPSLYEGFGLPPLEAMQYHIPVCSSEASCLPEILEDSALFFDPKDENDIAQAINRILTDENLRKILVENSQELLTKYSWGQIAKKTWEAYKNVL